MTAAFVWWSDPTGRPFGVPSAYAGALESEDVDPGACVFYLSPTNAERALEGADAEDAEALADRLGREVHVEESMPDDVVLFMDPDAIDEDGEVVEAHAIACGTVAAGE